MKITKGFRLYLIEDLRNRKDNEKIKYMEFKDVNGLNEALKKWGYEFKIKGVFRPYKFYNFRHKRSYSFSKLYEPVANELFVTYSFIVEEAEEEEKERLSGNHVKIFWKNRYIESSAALIFQDVDWVCFKEGNSNENGKMCILDKKSGSIREEDIIDPECEIYKLNYDEKLIEFII